VLDLDVDAPIWRRAWFVAGAAALLFGAGATLFSYRLRYLLGMERLRARIADDLHDDMGSSLTQISILSEVARSGSGGAQTLSEIAGLARKNIEQMNDIVWAVNPRHDRFEAMLQRMRRFASDTLEGADIELRFETGGLPPSFNLPIEMRRPLYLVFKEAVHNVVRHSGAKSAAIWVQLDRHVLKVIVEDDGRGFDWNEVRRGEGLRSMAERMKKMGGSAEWETSPGRGTRFTAAVGGRQRRRSS